MFSTFRSDPAYIVVKNSILINFFSEKIEL
jgi:hypothetical protein